MLAVSPGELALKPVRMILLIQSEHRTQIDRHFHATESALKWFGLWYGAYPYDTITVVDPPYGGGGVGNGVPHFHHRRHVLVARSQQRRSRERSSSTNSATSIGTA
jgi:hypothetical protein